MIIKSKKGVELTLQTIVILIIVLVVLVIVISFFATEYGDAASGLFSAGNDSIQHAAQE